MFTTGYGISTNSEIGIPVFDSQMTLGVNESYQLDITTDVYQQGFKNMSANIKSISL